MLPNDDNTACAICIGTFDASGIPISITKSYLTSYAAVAFQTISLNMLIARSLELNGFKTVYVRSKDGLVIRIERTLKGYIGYLETSIPNEPLDPVRLAFSQGQSS